MIARASQLFLPTLREAPADAEAVNHKLLVRGGFVRQVTGGVWTFLPLGWKVHRKIEQIIREEMDGIGCQEMLMPVLTPLELWQQSGRDFIPELFRLKDRKGAEYVLPLTHEETVTFHARELQSYRQLPQMLYHFSIKERDEPRPRAGLIRLREFIMKDAYSFDRDEAGLARNFELQHGAYQRIFERCGLKTSDVEAESGMMGGTESIDFLAPAGAGENTLVTCENGDFAADLEVARAVPRAPTFPEALAAPTEVETPDVKTCEALAAFLSIDVAATSKAMPVTTDDGTVVLALVRGDDRIEPAKLDAALGRPRGRRPTRRSAPRSVRAGDRSARSASRARSSPTRHCRAGSSSPVPTATAGTSAASRRVATSRRASPTFASPQTEIPARTAAAAFSSRRRSKSGTSSSWVRATQSRSAHGSSTRKARSALSSWGATGSAPPA